MSISSHKPVESIATPAHLLDPPIVIWAVHPLMRAPTAAIPPVPKIWAIGTRSRQFHSIMARLLARFFTLATRIGPQIGPLFLGFLNVLARLVRLDRFLT